MDDLEQSAVENEVCGICRDIVIDRGVLDCCQHWFCYTCIDNWAAITNRCPLCKIEFQHITSTPVYDTTGASVEDEYSVASGDDDWYVEGENNTLSFPSYYIDAEAVVCLDGGDCMIRSGLVAAEDDSSLDTSIACDSCDKWYHAICVGFNPEMTSEDSWLCPRCVYTEVKNKSDAILKQNTSGDFAIGSDRITVDTSFSGKVSVSVADDGETALVVSMVGVNSETGGGLLEGSLDLKTGQEAFNCNSYPSYSKDDFSHDGVANASIMSTDGGCRSYSKSSEINLARMVSSEQAERSFELSPLHESATTIFSSEHGNMPSEQLEVQQNVSSYPLHRGKETENTAEENTMPRNDNERSHLIKSPQLYSAAKTARSTDIDMVNTDAVQQMNNDKNADLAPMNDGHNYNDMESENETGRPAKKAKLEMIDKDMHFTKNVDVSSLDCPSTSIAAKADVSDMSEFITQEKYVPDIMSIVEGVDYIRDPGRELAKPVGRRAGEKAGLRVKKIFRKEEGKESSVVVQKLQQEIREVVRDNGIGILDKDNAFDEKLLTAFRAAIGKSIDVPDKRAKLSLMSKRRSLLQKSKIRENLTKKLYGTSTGRRRSAWHRDWEVDFWKRRCSPGINPEKIETLQSVLQLLKKSSDTAMRKESAEEKKAILSRLYLADASIVPRNDDIKPLSALEGCSPFDKNKKIEAHDGKATNKHVTGTATIKINSPNSTEKGSSSSTLNKEVSNRRENQNGQSSQNQQNLSSGDIKHDKRKWALEVLARKNASSVASKDQTKASDDLNGKYPLLAQLPVDMRPQLTAGRHNKIPMSVRQAQLYRIAEHYLQKANLDVIRRCADTELAIIDAVNVENDIFGKSSSKLVYVNLCSQATRQLPKAKSENDASTPTEKTELSSDPISERITTENTNISSSVVKDSLSRVGLLDLPTSTRHTEKSELGGAPKQILKEYTVSFNNVEDALKRAGLFDSPPNSPESKTTKAEGNSSTVSTSPIFSQRKCTSTNDTLLANVGECSLRHTVDLDSELSKSLQSTSDSGVRDASSLKYDGESLVQNVDDANYENLNAISSCNTEVHQKLIPGGEAAAATAEKYFPVNLSEADRHNMELEKPSETDKEILVDTPEEGTGHVPKEMDIAASDLHNQSRHGDSLKEGEAISKPKLKSPREKSSDDKQGLNSKHSNVDKSSGHLAEIGHNSKKPAPEGEAISKPKLKSPREKSLDDKQGLNSKHSNVDKSSAHPAESAHNLKKPAPDPANKSTSDFSSSVHKKVEVFVKENIRPLCKSGVITVEQYRWAVAKTAEKVMKHHSEAKNANFLIKEGDKVKNLALQYVEAAQQKIN